MDLFVEEKNCQTPGWNVPMEIMKSWSGDVPDIVCRERSLESARMVKFIMKSNDHKNASNRSMNLNLFVFREEKSHVEELNGLHCFITV